MLTRSHAVPLLGYAALIMGLAVIAWLAAPTIKAHKTTMPARRTRGLRRPQFSQPLAMTILFFALWNHGR